MRDVDSGNAPAGFVAVAAPEPSACTGCCFYPEVFQSEEGCPGNCTPMARPDNRFIVFKAKAAE